MTKKKMLPRQNIDNRVVEAFGEEWGHFTQAELPDAERKDIFEEYFSIFPWGRLPATGSIGADIGCGSGRWAMLTAPRVGTLHVLDASQDALKVARRNLAACSNIQFHHTSVDEMPFAEGSLDFAYSLGVLHHVPDTAAAIRDIAAKLKPGAPFLIYLYYAFDNRPAWYRTLWRISEMLRAVISRSPFALRFALSQLLSATVYWPLARIARLLEYFGCLPSSWPLAYYRDKSFYTMRTDALDRFGTRLEQRFSRHEIEFMLHQAGFGEICFAEHAPYWCAVGIKRC